MSRSEGNTTINLDIRVKKFENLTKFTSYIKNKYKNSKVILSYNDNLSLWSLKKRPKIKKKIHII